MKINYTDNQLTEIVNQCTSFRQTIFSLGFTTDSSYSYKRVRKDINRLQLNTIHWFTYNKKSDVKYKANVFCINSTVPIPTIKRYYKKISLYKCVKCNNVGTWNNSELVLQLDHINGNKKDNRLENLRWLCPNCHSQTNTYCRNTKSQ